MSRSLLLGLLVALGAILAALAASMVIEINATGQVAPMKVSLVGATLACLFVVIGILATQPSNSSQNLRCQHCGMRMYATLRSYDRREVLTCFGCGAEWLLPASVPREPVAPHKARPKPHPSE